MKRTKQSGIGRRRKIQEPLTPEMALTMLESAVSYCQSAGLKVSAVNGNNGTLGLFVPNAHYALIDNGTRTVFRLGAVSKDRYDYIGTLEASAHH